MSFKNTHQFQELKKTANKYLRAKIRDSFVGLFYKPHKDYRGAYNIEDPRDYEYEELVGAIEGELPSKVDLSKTLSEVQHQGLQEDTVYMCTAYANSHGSDILGREKIKGFYTGYDLGTHMYMSGTLGITTGAYTIDAVRANKKTGGISGYAKVSTLDEMKHSLENNRPIVMGSNQVDWRRTEETSLVITGTSYGHLWCCVGYDDTIRQFKCVNSYGKLRFNKGYFYLSYDDINLLFSSKYSLFLDSPEIVILTNYIEYFEEEKKRGITRVSSYRQISKDHKDKYENIILLAIRTVYGMSINEDMLL